MESQRPKSVKNRRCPRQRWWGQKTRAGMRRLIEAGDSRHPVARLNGGINSQFPRAFCGLESPYGLWGTLGIRAVRKIIEEQLNQ